MQGSTFLVQIGDYLFESPLSWYNGYGWDVSPGYASKNVLEFDRGVSKECLYCHATGARFDDPDGRHLVSKTLEPITCDRCHGSSEEHVRHPSRSNILNPAKLSGPVRDSICEQCHLEGTNRILNPGKDWTDFHTGEAAENVCATYVLHTKEQPEIPLASEVEQFAQSRCAQASKGKFWCGTCHNPHRAPQPREVEIKAVCTSCHQKLSPAAHPASLKECTSCHMPTTKKVTISHASHTDHRILRYPGAHPEAPQKPSLVAWREPPEQFRQRDLGLSELLLSPTENEDLWRNGASLLISLNPDQLKTDADVASALEDYYFRTGDTAKAVESGRRSVELNPRSATAALAFARALQASGAAAEAEEQFLEAISQDPSLKEAYGRLAVYYAQQGRTEDATNILDRYLHWNSNEIFFHVMEQKLLSQKNGVNPQ
jgi:predicted CXXCH cytochrome family protein